MDLIVGLGNPGRKYSNTRHNIGFIIVNALGRELGVNLTGRRFQSRNVRSELNGRELILLRPLTYMNMSGKSVIACADHYHIKKDHILIVHDDLDLPLGKVKATCKGGSGGHRGVQSIFDHFNDTAFTRIKVGIGRPECGEKIEDFVLSPFYKDQKALLNDVISYSVHACKLVLSEGVKTAMNRINGKNLKLKEGINECRN